MSQPELVRITTGTGYEVPLQVFRAASAHRSILLLPALGMAARFYATFAATLAQQDITSVVLEQRGHGDSGLRADRHTDWGFREWLQEDIPAALDWIAENLPGTGLTLMGHSLGGHLAACYVGANADADHLPQRIILPACATPWAGAYAATQRRQLWLLCRLIPPLGAMLGFFPGNWFGFGGRESRGMMRDWRRIVPDNRYHAEGMPVDFEAGIARYSGKILSIRFDADPLAPEAGVEAVLAKFEQATVQRTLLESEKLGFRADHFKWARQPEVTVDSIASWLGADP